MAERVAEVGATRMRVMEGLRGLEDLADFGAADGAFYVYLRLRRFREVLDLTRRLIAEHGVAVIPGTAFGVTQEACLRVAYGALSPATAEEGVGRLVCGLRQLAG